MSSRLAAMVAGTIILSALAGCTTDSLQSAGLTGQKSSTVTAAPVPPATATAGAATGQQTQTATQATAAPATSEASASTRHYSHRRHRKATTHSDAPAPSSSTRQTAKEESKGTATTNAPFVEEGAAQSKTYPKFVPPKAATTQMTDAEKKAFEAQMAARMKAAAPPQNETPAEHAERMKLLRALAAQHSEDTLKAIEGQK